MCGIVGYIGNAQAYPILIKGLKRLEYRGYDSAGVAMVGQDGELNIYKAKGKVCELERYADDKDTRGTIGIAHTRWATHGEPSDVNAHPHYSTSENLALIHNGIIENYAVLREMLTNNGMEFRSCTDTEVIVQLVEFIKRNEGCDLLRAVQLTLPQLTGAYALAIVERNNPDTIIAARKSSPLVVGIGENEYFLASDATPIVEFTKNVVYLNDEEMAVIDRHSGLKVVSIDNVERTPSIERVTIDIAQLEKGGYEHFMLKEIFEQPRTILDCTRGRISVDKRNVTLSGIIDHSYRLINARRVTIVACGTSWHASLIGKQLIESFCRIPVEVEYASEFRYRNPVIGAEDVVIAISQSGETADTLAAVELAKSRGAFVYAMCNAIGSSIARAAHTGSYIHVGPEIGVASTKAFTGQVTTLTMFALTLAKAKGSISQYELERVVGELTAIPEKIAEILTLNDYIKELSLNFVEAHNFIYLGRGYNFPVALEGALKLKEISYIHAEGYPAAEMKHGPIALIDEHMPVVVIATNNGLYEKVISNIQEVKARKGMVIAVVSKGDTTVCGIADYTIEIPETIECLDPLITSVPLQMLAYHIAVSKGCNVDQPRNLAKSVTVE